jgi:hypothetical protein
LIDTQCISNLFKDSRTFFSFNRIDTVLPQLGLIFGLKGTVSRDFLLLVFFMNQFPPSPRVFHLDHFDFFRKFAEIFASQGAPPVSATPVANLPPVSTTPVAKLPPVSMTPVANLPPVSAPPVANFSIIFASVVDTGGKFATGVIDAGGKLPPVSTTPVANNGNNIRLQTP